MFLSKQKLCYKEYTERIMDAQKVRLFSSKIAVGETTILEKREERILEKIFLGISVFLECIILN